MKRAVLAVATFLTLAPMTQAKEILPFIENDYTKALAQAKSKKLPLFVDAWAPW